MEDVLYLYNLPLDEKRPVVCFDELPVQLLGEVVAPLPMKAGHSTRFDDEYEREGTADREVLNGVLWILRSGARWRDLPGRFPPYQACHRRFQHWVRDGRLKRVLETLAEDLRARGDLDLSECFIDGTFVVAKKGAQKSERPSGARVRSSGRWQTALVFLSPSTRRMLRRMKSDLSEGLSSNASPMRPHSD